MTQYIERKGQLERVWRFTHIVNGFNVYSLCRGTEREVRAYLESELSIYGKGWYRACTEEEEEAARVFGMTVYIAPQL